MEKKKTYHVSCIAVRVAALHYWVGKKAASVSIENDHAGWSAKGQIDFFFLSFFPFFLLLFSVGKRITKREHFGVCSRRYRLIIASSL
jgi:hypothetical protein